MSLTYISALYDIASPDARTHSGSAQRIELLQRLLQTGVRIVVFLDPAYRNLIDATVYPNATFQYDPLTSFATYASIMAQPLALPQSRNMSKDTQAFLALMNTKPEFLKRALPNVHTDYIAWIDSSIFHIVSDEARVVQHLTRTVSRPIPSGLLLPGPHDLRKSGAVSEETVASRIVWYFAGGLFVATKEAAARFHATCSRLVDKWIAAGRITWEVNVWVQFAQENPDAYDWVYADHNDSLCCFF